VAVSAAEDETGLAGRYTRNFPTPPFQRGPMDPKTSIRSRPTGATPSGEASVLVLPVCDIRRRPNVWNGWKAPHAPALQRHPRASGRGGTRRRLALSAFKSIQGEVAVAG